jgi:hypothetical protein
MKKKKSFLIEKKRRIKRCKTKQRKERIGIRKRKKQKKRKKGKMKTRSQASYLVKRENNKKLLVKKGYGSKRTYI